MYRQLFLTYIFFVACVPYFIDVKIVEGFRLNPHRVFLVLSLALFSAQAFARNAAPIYSRKQKSRRGGGALLALASLHYIALIVSGIAAGGGLPLFLSVNAALTNFAVLLMAIHLCKTQPEMRSYYVVVAISLITVTTMVMLEASTGRALFAGIIEEGRNNALNREVLVREGAARLKGPFDHPLTLAQYVVVFAPIAIFAAPKKLSRPAIRAFFMIAFGFLVAVTRSRFGALMYACQLLAAFLVPLNRARQRTMISRGPLLMISAALVLAVPALLIASNAEIADRYFGRNLLDANVRDVQLANGVLAIEESPLVGYGLGDNARAAIYEQATSGKGEWMWEQNAGAIDNYYLSIAVGAGIPALLSFILMHLLLVIRGVACLPQIWRNSASRGGRYHFVYLGFLISYICGVASMSVLSIFSIHSLVYVSMGVVYHYCFKSELAAGAKGSRISKVDPYRQESLPVGTTSIS